VPNEKMKIPDIYPVQWTENIWLLGIREFPSFLVVGKKSCALIEAGVSLLVPKILTDLKSLNLSVPLKHLIITHPHADHVAGLMKLRYIIPDVVLVGSEDSAYILGKKTVIRNFAEDDVMYGNYLLNNRLFQGTNEQLSTDPMKVDIVVDNHELIDIGNVQLHFIDAPGHAPGNMAILIKPDNAILISDAAGYAKAENDIYPLFFHNYNRYINSLKKINFFKPDHLGLGHNLLVNSQESSIKFIDHAITRAEQLKKRITDETDGNTSPEKPVSEIADQLIHYGLFKSFSWEALISLSNLLIRRALEK